MRLMLTLIAVVGLTIACGQSTPRGADADGDVDGDGDGDGDSDGDGDGDACPDSDGDGHELLAPGCGDDCDDSDPATYPGARERCGDGEDNDCDGEVDEGCAEPDCESGELRSCSDDGRAWQWCQDSGDWDECLECPRWSEIPYDERCGDRVDNDCDGEVDEGCTEPAECLCLPGQERWCDTPDYSLWGRQACDADGATWGPCVEGGELPAACRGIDSWYSPALEACLIDIGECGQDMWDIDNDGDLWESLGDCVGIACPPEGCLCRPGARRYCDAVVYSLLAEQLCNDDGLSWGRAVEVRLIPAGCGEVEDWFSPAQLECLVEAGECVCDYWDLDGDGDTWESIGDCRGITCALD